MIPQEVQAFVSQKGEDLFYACMTIRDLCAAGPNNPFC